MFKVIVADDEKIIRIAMQSIIKWQEYGFELIGVVQDGKETVELLRKTGADLIITDLKMPNMDGMELINYLKENKYNGEIIVLSNHGDYELVREAMKRGATDYLLKVTMNPKELIEVLNSVKKILKEKEEYNKSAEIYKEEYNHNKDLIRYSNIRDYLRGDINYDELCENIKDIKDKYLDFSNRLMHLYIDNYKELYKEKIKDKGKLAISITNIVNECLAHIDHELHSINNHKYLIVINCDHCRTEELSLSIQKTINLYMNFTVSIIISEEFNGIEELKEKFQNCENIRSNKYFNKKNCIINENEYKDIKEYKKEISEIINFVNRNVDKRISLCMISKFVNMNESYLSRLFKNETGKNLMYFINEVKMEKAKEMLKEPQSLVKEVANNVGIPDQFYFNRVFKKFYGVSPTQFKREFIKKL